MPLHLFQQLCPVSLRAPRADVADAYVDQLASWLESC
jgi:hypothetical protein